MRQILICSINYGLDTLKRDLKRIQEKRQTHLVSGFNDDVNLPKAGLA